MKKLDSNQDKLRFIFDTSKFLWRFYVCLSAFCSKNFVFVVKQTYFLSCDKA